MSRTEWQERIGVGEPCRALTSTEARKPTRRRKVIREEGPGAGTVGGYQTDHANGRLDAHVMAETVTATIDRDHPLHPKHPDSIHPLARKES